MLRRPVVFVAFTHAAMVIWPRIFRPAGSPSAMYWFVPLSVSAPAPYLPGEVTAAPFVLTAETPVIDDRKTLTQVSGFGYLLGRAERSD